MKTNSILSILSVLVTVSFGIVSCDVVSTFSVQNKSRERKLVEVVGIKMDSVGIEPMLSKTSAAKMVEAKRNSFESSCSFYLDPNETAWLEWGWGRGYRTRQVIVNNSNTIQTIKTVWRNGKPPKNKYLAPKKQFYRIGGDYQVVLR